MTLFFPWNNGLKVEEIEAYYDNYKFPDGHRFFDWQHAETGAELLKAQHPEFEMWSQGVHARSGVTCADCHMPYKRAGALKMSDHYIRSPLLMVDRACQIVPPLSRGGNQVARRRDPGPQLQPDAGGGEGDGGDDRCDQGLPRGRGER